MLFWDYFKGKKVTVMRIGLLGRGVGDTAYMAEAGAEITVVDAAPQEVMQPSVDALAQYENVTFKFGPYDFADFEDVDFVWVGAGAPLDEPVLTQCREAGIPLKQSAALFAELSRVPIIGVTGTRGKSTVTTMIHHVLSYVTGEQVLLGGNIRGVSNLQLLNDVNDDSLCVMELDSWQLQGFGWAGISPQVAVFTTFMEDHLNYYQREGMSKDEAMSAYFADKAQIFLHQDEAGTLITTPAVFEWIKKEFPGETLGQEVVLADSSLIPEDAHLAMPGEHNRLNAALAYKALEAVGLPEAEIFEGLATFPGVEGRLQLVKTVDNVRIYNDNNATEPNATIAGLKALDLGNQNIILIAGGADKNVDLAPLALAIKDHCKRVILTPGSGTEKLLGIIHDTEQVITVENLEHALVTAKDTAENGDIILFSPAFASFAQYKNEYERNDEFMSLINKI
ncbi:UDP-N-acetylmuramoyl-L-alanine--D-glutamate ligase [bacterium]|nr:UDP-N-acetylmuramoyl-L-alanine--D-glutamate ligase [bacterium]|tara:strand:+ start:2380 stop:3735 length:1356 start_codon:yes stop_codon:yes gene_type:complete